MNTKFSKGPWVVKGGLVMSADGYVVCTPSAHSPHMTADTRLTASALQLLEACEDLLDAIDTGDLHGAKMDRAYEAARKAIATAYDK